MTELAIIILFIALLFAFVYMRQGNKIVHITILTLLGIILIVVNNILPSQVIVVNSYIGKEIIDNRINYKVEFEQPMFVVKMKIDRPYTTIGDEIKYMIGLPNKKPKILNKYRKQYRRNII